MATIDDGWAGACSTFMQVGCVCVIYLEATNNFSGRKKRYPKRPTRSHQFEMSAEDIQNTQKHTIQHKTTTTICMLQWRIFTVWLSYRIFALYVASSTLFFWERKREREKTNFISRTSSQIETLFYDAKQPRSAPISEHNAIWPQLKQPLQCLGNQSGLFPKLKNFEPIKQQQQIHMATLYSKVCKLKLEDTHTYKWDYAERL